jgi:hypothetical protein
MQTILRQDYDPYTLDSLGDPQVVFNEEEDHISASGIEIAQSPNGSKTAMLVKCYYRQQKYKVILTDNHLGRIYAKVFDMKPVKDYLKFIDLKVSNEGQVFIAAKVRDDVVTLNNASKDKKPVLYYFFSIDNSADEPKLLTFTSPEDRDKYPADPVLTILNNGELLITRIYSQTDKSPVVKGIFISTYNADFNLTGKKDIPADPKLLAQVGEFMKSKKETGFAHLELRQVLPLYGGDIILIAGNRQASESKDKNSAPVIEIGYLLAYRLDDKLELRDARLIPKKQSSASVNYAFSTQAYGMSNDVYLFHNDDWPTDDEHSMELQCTRLPAKGGEPETKKVLRTSEDFFTSMQHIHATSDGRVLFTEEKLVDFGGISKEIKLLEITVK